MPNASPTRCSSSRSRSARSRSSSSPTAWRRCPRAWRPPSASSNRSSSPPPSSCRPSSRPSPQLVLTRKLPRMAVITAVVVTIFGGLTLVLRDDTFVKMKPTILYSLFAGILGFGLLRGQSYLKYLMDELIPMQHEGWINSPTASSSSTSARRPQRDRLARLRHRHLGQLPHLRAPAANFAFIMAQFPLFQRYAVQDEAEGGAVNKIDSGNFCNINWLSLCASCAPRAGNQVAPSITGRCRSDDLGVSGPGWRISTVPCRRRRRSPARRRCPSRARSARSCPRRPREGIAELGQEAERLGRLVLVVDPDHRHAHAASSASSGCSARQGAHQLAQKLTSFTPGARVRGGRRGVVAERHRRAPAPAPAVRPARSAARPRLALQPDVGDHREAGRSAAAARAAG